MSFTIFNKLFNSGHISAEELQHIQAPYPKSVHWELRTLLYLGILLTTTGAGILVYENIDTIGHTVIISAIALACAACFAYCFKTSSGFVRGKVTTTHILQDYILLLGCLLLLSFIGYIQYQYTVFGSRLGMASFIPMVLLFASAYYFDHLGVLSLAITNLAAWAGIVASPLNILSDNDFNNVYLIYTAILLGVILIAMAVLSTKKQLKAHFAFTYKNFGAHILFIALLAAIIQIEQIYLLWFLVLLGVVFYFFTTAVAEQSFYFFVITVLYAYFGISYVIMDFLIAVSGYAIAYFIMIYFIASGIALIRLFMYYNKKLKQHDSL
jgi:hypothetical protein